MHPHTIIATVLGCGVLAVVAFVRPRVEEVIVGDVPRIPREMRPSGDKAGGVPSIAREPLTRTMDRTHVGAAIPARRATILCRNDLPL